MQSPQPAAVHAGAGILALPAVTKDAGFVPSCAALLGCYLFSAMTGLFITEVSHSTSGSRIDRETPVNIQDSFLGILEIIQILRELQHSAQPHGPNLSPQGTFLWSSAHISDRHIAGSVPSRR